MRGEVWAEKPLAPPPVLAFTRLALGCAGIPSLGIGNPRGLDRLDEIDLLRDLIFGRSTSAGLQGLKRGLKEPGTVHGMPGNFARTAARHGLAPKKLAEVVPEQHGRGLISGLMLEAVDFVSVKHDGYAATIRGEGLGCFGR